LVDFGLVHQVCSSLTDPRALIGSLEFMAPEQSHDASAVGAAADIYGLGATLFWLLTGEPPYPSQRVASRALRALQNDPPRRLRSLRPDAPAQLDALGDRLLARDPAARPALPLTVMNALTPFAAGSAPLHLSAALVEARWTAPDPTAQRVNHPILIVDDEVSIRNLSRATLEACGYPCTEV